jgi:hypothetical protein
MEIKSIDDIRRYYPDLLQEYRDQVIREARKQRVEEQARNIERVRRLFGLDGEAGEQRAEMREESTQTSERVRRLFDLIEGGESE